MSEPEGTELNADLLESGITGGDFTLPLFDGRSENPVDHIIDLDTDSMERCPDVRVYFWMMGLRVLKREIWGFEEPGTTDRPTDANLRLQYDDNLVKMGREYLRVSMIGKEGYYLSSNRDRFTEYLAGRRPDSPWYRFPAIALVERLLEEAEKNGHEDWEVEEDVPEWPSTEDSFFDIKGDKAHFLDVAKTNIRVPIIWTELLKKGVVPGTRGWDTAVMARYGLSDHPVYMLLRGGVKHFELLSSILMVYTGSQGFFPCDYESLDRVLETDFPYLKEPVTDSEDRDEGVDYSELYEHMSNTDDFLYGKKEYRKKKKLFGVIPLPW